MLYETFSFISLLLLGTRNQKLPQSPAKSTRLVPPLLPLYGVMTSMDEWPQVGFDVKAMKRQVKSINSQREELGTR
ncbi:hypothetical protein MUCCIDRAFT_107601 [Mucor lusitanicus CBS 277.49]|uniref:Uncharacterized protein n=1 Tax=Mucor lusitanicus CBS 277.49 TaxID=747725 RepID=A0A168P0X5_MUCCL|nr:hypothetical protein MUCCIDRAFT_107601 [Mucor lusitanicus CBS 277.49]